METNIWYCPRLEDLKKELPDVVRRAITIKTKRSIELQRQVQTLCEESKNFENDLNDQIDLIQELVEYCVTHFSCKITNLQSHAAQKNQ